MRDHVRFHSTAFTPADVEPGRINTERYGYALATWVATRLKERGFAADSPVPEDWGWLLDVTQQGRIVRIGCGNVEGSVSEWVIWLDVARPGLLARLVGRSHEVAPNAAYGIVAAIHGALQASGHAEDIEWFRVGPRGEEVDHAATPI
jgi:hypothetical protein